MKFFCLSFIAFYTFSNLAGKWQLAAADFPPEKNNIKFYSKSRALQDSPILLPYPSPKQSPTGLYGYVDDKGSFTIEPSFEKALSFSDGVARVMQKGVWGIIDQKGKFVVRPKYEEILEFKTGTAIVRVKGKISDISLFGLIDVSGKELIIPQYNYFTADYQNQLFIAGNIQGTENGKNKVRFGMVNKKNTTLIPLNFKDLKHTRYRTFAGKNDKNTWQFFDSNGKAVFGNNYLEINDFDENAAVVKKASGWRIVLPDGKPVTDSIYKAINRKSSTFYDLVSFPQKLVLDEKNKTILATHYADLQYIDDQVFCYSKDEKKGLADAKGNQVTENVYHTISTAKKGYCIVSTDEGYGVIDKKGKKIIGNLYQKVEIDSASGLFKVQENGRWMVMNITGKAVTQVKYDEIKIQPYGMMFARQGEQWFLLNAEGKLISTHSFSEVSDFQNLHAITKWRGGTGIIDMKSDWIIEPVFDSLKMISSHLVAGYSKNTATLLNIFSKDMKYDLEKIEPLSGSYFFKIISNGKQGVINYRGQEVISPIYKSVSGFTKDSIVAVSSDQKYGLINLKGRVILPLELGYEEMREPQEERVGVKINGKYGFVDVNGGLRIAHRYDGIQPFSEGLAAFKLKNKWGFLNLKEEIVIQPQYDVVCDFKNSISCVQKSGKWGFVDKKGREILRPQFDKVMQIPSGKFISEENGKMGLVSADGRELIHPNYNHIKPLKTGHFLVSRNGKTGLLNSNGLDAIPVMYDNLVTAGNYFIATIQPPPVSFELK